MMAPWMSMPPRRSTTALAIGTTKVIFGSTASHTRHLAGLELEEIGNVVDHAGGCGGDSGAGRLADQLARPGAKALFDRGRRLRRSRLHHQVGMAQRLHDAFKFDPQMIFVMSIAEPAAPGLDRIQHEGLEACKMDVVIVPQLIACPPDIEHLPRQAPPVVLNVLDEILCAFFDVHRGRRIGSLRCGRHRQNQPHQPGSISKTLLVGKDGVAELALEVLEFEFEVGAASLTGGEAGAKL